MLCTSQVSKISFMELLIYCAMPAHVIKLFLTHWGLVTHDMGHHWFKLWPHNCLASSHYLKHCWLIVKCIMRNWLLNELWVEIQTIYMKMWSTKNRDQFRYVPSQWETLFHCNDVPHWLGTYLDWSLNESVILVKPQCVNSVVILFSIWHKMPDKLII